MIEPNLKKNISDFFTKEMGQDQNVEDQIRWQNLLTKCSKDIYNSNKGTLNERIVHGIKAGTHWDNSTSLQQRELLNSQNEKLIQDQQATPILFGCDVVALYPNLEPIIVAHVAAQTVKESDIKFSGVNFYFLIAYL